MMFLHRLLLFCLLSAVSIAIPQRFRRSDHETPAGDDQPVDGGWSEWNLWSKCSKSCGTGGKFRSRSCTNPSPSHGGKVCEGSGLGFVSCNEHSCEVDGGWTEWTDFSQCTKSCGFGSQIRSRTCTNPEPKHDGKPCFGPREEAIECTIDDCPVNGEWSYWSNWTSCTVSCGGGLRNRTRVCNNPVPAYGGRDCSGYSWQNETCSERPCPVDGKFSSWSNWTFCSATCGGGVRRRVRYCDDPSPSFGGRNCTGPWLETGECNDEVCPIDGKWSEWEDWSDCSKSCGTGFHIRQRHCNNPAPQFGGLECPGFASENDTCNVHFCPVNGSWSDWTSWTDCSESCEGGIQYRSRFCDNPRPNHDGLDCVGSDQENRPCNQQQCPLDGGWGTWMSWSTCTATCNGGTQSRSRLCNNPKPQFGGLECPGHGSEDNPCGTSNCPVHGGWSSWTQYSKCSKSCLGGLQCKYRYCNNPTPRYGGNTCSGEPRNCILCNVFDCPVDGAWGSWSQWLKCTLSCGGGTKQRSRKCDNPAPENGGKTCDGSAEEEGQCNQESCPVDGGWTDWSTWSLCSVTCGGGGAVRRRFCTNPSPLHGGRYCEGDELENATCSTTPCPVDGGWAEWTDYSECTTTCGFEGNQQRTRSCTNPEPMYKGEPCNGPAAEEKSCPNKNCPVDGQWAEWYLSERCSQTCNYGTAGYRRICWPQPKYGGKPCVGSDTETRVCYLLKCPPIDGVWMLWSTWSACSSAVCRSANLYSRRTRQRTCTEPQHGGKPCSGDATQEQECSVSCTRSWSTWSAQEHTNVCFTNGYVGSSRNRTCVHGSLTDCPVVERRSWMPCSTKFTSCSAIESYRGWMLNNGPIGPVSGTYYSMYNEDKEVVYQQCQFGCC
ncbi:A disintegrin and metalloproteinase with thrombospondin motifs adt-1-like isoform X3 [Corticium candelabrum]|uniref:A disintegrin and metalloproteinase with thrombospondin motifs adt-1-like isoform X3 n=1 Tax=Corticium candelabrum TaxID=121492 RepID=UPI002E269105|nr:A disintegrin and metalloproteinase with thrombospondin motifs adt-1-like isoform X3 [Corticium candelabrum]